jgi:hypothetical protein
MQPSQCSNNTGRLQRPTGDPSFWRDPSLSPDKWDTAVRLAVSSASKWISGLCSGPSKLSVSDEGHSSTDTNIVPISSSPAEGSVTPSPAWPFSDSCCYIFPRSMKFLCYPVKYSLSLLPGCSAQPTSISSD